MGKRLEGGAAGLVALFAAGLALAAGPAGAGLGRAAGQDGPRAGRQVAPGSSFEAQAVSQILARLWASCFFRRNEAVRAEILDNRYDLFEGGAPGSLLGRTGCYSKRPDGQDVIFLRKDLLSHFELGLEGIAQRANVIRIVLPVLVHEICHDLWANILDARERASFARECEGLLGEYRRAVTAEEQKLFLLHAGDDASDTRSLRSYAGIDGFLATDPPRALCGQEMFAWLAERLFTTKAKIPEPLRKYYACILEGPPPGTAAPRR